MHEKNNAHEQILNIMQKKTNVPQREKVAHLNRLNAIVKYFNRRVKK